MMPLVVKLGGSTAGRDEMQAWLEVLAGATWPLVIVPGGGPFADHIRFQQKRLKFSDDAAHDMAILSMDQFGLMLAERHVRLRTAGSVEDFESAWRADRIPVWLPSVMTRGAPDIPRSWAVTSDSLAAWLCGKIGAERLLLIKQVEPAPSSDVRMLADSGIVDGCFSKMLDDSTVLHVAGPQTLDRLHGQAPLTEVPGRCIRRTALEGVGRQ